MIRSWRACNTSFNANERYFADDIFKFIFLYENCCIFIEIELQFVTNGSINDIS